MSSPFDLPISNKNGPLGSLSQKSRKVRPVESTTQRRSNYSCLERYREVTQKYDDLKNKIIQK
jgi:hypothetical protein